jgi:hypothetical protein
MIGSLLGGLTGAGVAFGIFGVWEGVERLGAPRTDGAAALFLFGGGPLLAGAGLVAGGVAGAVVGLGEGAPADVSSRER